MSLGEWFLTFPRLMVDYLNLKDEDTVILQNIRNDPPSNTFSHLKRNYISTTVYLMTINDMVKTMIVKLLYEKKMQLMQKWKRHSVLSF
jgi:hypothetical protein